MREWIMASDRMPDPHGDDVLMYYEWTGKSGTVYRQMEIGTPLDLPIPGTYRLIAWMPLPEPPEEYPPNGEVLGA